MAGAGYKLFQTGDVLTAAQVNTYLNEQTVMVFANAAARTSALTSVLAEGMVSYLQDTNAVEVYNGSAWVGVSGTGDVTEVQAGTGISVASGTGPIPVVTNTMATAIDAKGDLVVGTGADTFSRLAVGGTNGHTLQVDSSTATGLKWAAPAGGGGKVLQVIHASYATATSNSTSTYADTGLSATITPTLASSKVLVLVSQNGLQKSAGNLGSRISLRLLRGATEIASIADYIQFNGAAQETIDSSATFNYLDSPATTSATTYKTQFQNPANVASVTVQFNGVGTSHIVLMEIGA
jgi:hypothetical protein